MGIYKTYQEAVIDSGSINNIQVNLNGGEFYTGDSWRDVSAVVRQCNPADYLETLESFLDSGKRFVEGDSYIEKGGNVVSVFSDDAYIYSRGAAPQSTANEPMEGDDNRYALQAAAYDTETPEEKEAFDAIDNTPQRFESLSGSEKPNISDWDGEGLPPVGVEFDFSLNGEYWERRIMLFNDGITCLMANSEYPTNRWHYKCEDPDIMLRKPETPYEREERERLEAAYDLYLTARSSTNDYTITFNQFCDSMVKSSFLAIVDKTGYRRQ